MNHGGVKVVDMNAVFDDVVTIVIIFSVGNAWFDTTARHPDREAARVVIATKIIAEWTLTVVGAAKFSSPDDEGIIEHSASLKIGDECCGRLIGFSALDSKFFHKATVLIPALVVELDELHAAFGESASHQAVSGISAGGFGVFSVELVSSF